MLKELWIVLRTREAGTYDIDSLDLIADQILDYEGNDKQVAEIVSQLINQPIGAVVHYPNFNVIRVYDTNYE